MQAFREILARIDEHHLELAAAQAEARSSNVYPLRDSGYADLARTRRLSPAELLEEFGGLR